MMEKNGWSKDVFFPNISYPEVHIVLAQTKSSYTHEDLKSYKNAYIDIEMHLKCLCKHKYTWSSHAYMRDEKYVVNYRMIHGLGCSGTFYPMQNTRGTSCAFHSAK